MKQPNLTEILFEGRMLNVAVAPKDTGESNTKPRRKRRRRGVLWTVGILILLIVLAVGGMHFTSQPGFCGNCHQIKPLVTSWNAGPHKQVSCLDCHANPGTIGYVTRKIQGLKEVYEQATNQVPAVLVPKINTQTCINCHTGTRADYPQAKNIKLTSGAQAPRVSHQEILSKNLSCLICHRYTAHPSLETSPTSND